jgi:hypothetical protein
MFAIHIYHSARHLFLAEMGVLFWIQAFFALGAVVFGYIVWRRFRLHRRSVLWTGIHLSWVVLFWLFFLFMWYFWHLDRALWAHVIAPWHYDVFRLALGWGLITTIAGLILHHGRPKVEFTRRLLWLHVSSAGLTTVLWVMADWIFH